MEVFYRDDQLKVSPSHNKDFLRDVGPLTSKLSAENEASDEVKCVKIYCEVEYDMFQHHGDEATTRAWVEAVWSQVILLYQQDGLIVQMQTLNIWDTEDPYTSTRVEKKVKDFKKRLNGQFEGDIAHLIGFQGNGGMAAAIGDLCNKKIGLAYSGLDKTYEEIPTYSWSVVIIAHEMGHTYGARHTHACVWGDDGKTAVDCCGYDLGYNECGRSGCNANPNLPTNGGTIMSYCDEMDSVGVNFNNGFAPDVLELMLRKVDEATCLGTCDGCFNRWYEDADGDSFGNPNKSMVSCDQPEGYVANKLDCDDAAADITDGQTYYEDADADGYGNDEVSKKTCTQPEKYVENNDDCNDGNNAIHPGATELCNGIDDDCNGDIDDVLDENLPLFYQDADGDLYGNPLISEPICPAPEGFVSDNTDCDDDDNSVWIGAPCVDTDFCEPKINEECECQVYDTDEDGVCDGQDQCPGEDDSIDTNDNGTPDCAERVCKKGKAKWPIKKLNSKQASRGRNETSLEFDSPISNAELKVFNLGSRKNEFEDVVTVTYTDVDGNINTVTETYTNASGDIIEVNAMTWEHLKIINADITKKKDKNDWNIFIERDDITSITINVANGVEGSNKPAKVGIWKKLKYCTWEVPAGN